MAKKSITFVLFQELLEELKQPAVSEIDGFVSVDWCKGWNIRENFLRNKISEITNKLIKHG